MKSRTSSTPSISRRHKNAEFGVRSAELRRRAAAPDSALRIPQSAFHRVPGATYRLQFNANFTLRHAREIVDYLHGLGVTDVYASPLFQAGPESTHGYDTCSHSQIGECLGGEEAFEQLSAALRERGMGLLLDIVPNHMGACAANAWWWDVLKHGRESKFARYFDIDWERGSGKVLLPVLGGRLPEVLRDNQLKLVRENGEWVISYCDKRLPVARQRAASVSLARLAERQRDAGGTLTPRDWLELLDAQHYRLAYWRVGPHEINYRRFFDVTGLVAVRMEEREVFNATHAKLFDLVRDGSVTGLRVDHPDGLRDPREFFVRLQEKFAGEGRLFVVGEKILSGAEVLPRDWPAAGTTGYDFLVQLNALFVSRDNEAAMSRVYQEFTGDAAAFDDVAYESKKRVLELSFAGDVHALAERLHEIAARSFSGRDLTRAELRAAIVELISCFGVYRTYVTERTNELSAQDAEVIRRAHSEAKPRASNLAAAIDFLTSVLSLDAEFASDADAREFVLKFQQLSGPAAAKGIEDTAFYNYFRLISLNEVGGEPGEFGVSVEEFHERNKQRAEHWPHSLLATSTHDTKRGEDTRARINVLSEIPYEWRDAVMRWRDMNARFKTRANGGAMPDARDEYLFYQTLVGTWTAEGSTDAYRDRVAAYMLKAVKEAKRHTSWTEPNGAYENATKRFVESALAATNGEFLGDFVKFQRKVAFFGVFNSLSQTLLKVTSPGVPDIYQGTELWDFSVVDPDNRRPVDFSLRRTLLEQLRVAERPHMDAEVEHGAVKLFAIQRALEIRNRQRELFDCGKYVPLTVRGAAREHVCAFARVRGSAAAVTIAPRLACTLLRGQQAPPVGPDVWRDSEVVLPAHLESHPWLNVMTGECVDGARRLRVGEVLNVFPVALLVAP